MTGRGQSACSPAADKLAREKPMGFFTDEFRSTWELKSRILWCLARGGEVRDESGRATSALADEVGWDGSLAYFSTMIATMEDDGLLKRDKNARRTYGISLAISRDQLARHERYSDDLWSLWAKNRRSITTAQPEPEAEAEAEAEAPLTIVPAQVNEFTSGPDAAEADSDDDSRQVLEIVEDFDDPHACLAVAMRLMVRAMGVMQPVGAVQTIIDPELAERLASTLGDNQRLRNKVSALEDAMRARGQELEAQRKARRAAEDALAAVARNGHLEGPMRNLSALDKLVRTAPQSAKAG